MTTDRRVATSEIAGYLDDLLRIREVPDEPNAVNGLQVANSGSVGRIVAAVDASMATIEGVVADTRGSGPSLLVVHHGLFWDGNLPVTERRYRRLKALLDRDIAVYAAHIPLDIHPELGNNAVLARQLELEECEPFDTYKGKVALGVRGVRRPAVARTELARRLESLLDTSVKLIPGGPEHVERIGIITGGAGGRIAAAKEAGLDTYITGEGAHHTYFDAMELGVNVLYAGHYATEQVGVRALAEHLGAAFGLPWEYHHHPTGL